MIHPVFGEGLAILAFRSWEKLSMAPTLIEVHQILIFSGLHEGVIYRLRLFRLIILCSLKCGL